MIRVKLGKVGLTNEGPWEKGKSFPQLAVVSYEGLGYISFKPSTGVEPGTDESVWMLICQRGESLYQMMVRNGLFEGTEDEFLAQYNDAIKAIYDNVALSEQTLKNVQEVLAQILADEDRRKDEEAARVEGEKNRHAAEAERVAAETAREEVNQARTTEFSEIKDWHASAKTAIESATQKADSAASEATAAVSRANTAAESAETASTEANALIDGAKADFQTFKDQESARVSAETLRAGAEEERVGAETSRVTAENKRKENETARVEAETLRVQAENERNTEEDIRVKDEILRKSAESDRSLAETSREAAEGVRAEAETTRIESEATRESAETARASVEQGRVTAENERNVAEEERVKAEAKRASAESKREQMDETREASEAALVISENSRVSAENTRIVAESAREDAESARVVAETARAKSESDRVGAESARVLAESARVGVEKARVQADSQRDVAENARASAEQVRVADETKRREAEDARVEEFSQIKTENATALQNMQNATSEATTAAGSANTATESANTAATSANEAAEVASALVPRMDNLEDLMGTRQPKLVSGTNISTVNGQDITKGGDVQIASSGVVVSDTQPTDEQTELWVDTSANVKKKPDEVTVVQTMGNSMESVMSQDAATKAFSNLNSLISDVVREVIGPSFQYSERWGLFYINKDHKICNIRNDGTKRVLKSPRVSDHPYHKSDTIQFAVINDYLFDCFLDVVNLKTDIKIASIKGHGIAYYDTGYVNLGSRLFVQNITLAGIAFEINHQDLTLGAENEILKKGRWNPYISYVKGSFLYNNRLIFNLVSEELYDHVSPFLDERCPEWKNVFANIVIAKNKIYRFIPLVDQISGIYENCEGSLYSYDNPVKNYPILSASSYNESNNIISFSNKYALQDANNYGSTIHSSNYFTAPINNSYNIGPYVISYLVTGDIIIHKN